MRELISGNEAIVKGAIAAGADFYAGYPITPSSEVMEELSKIMPKLGRKFVQMEDEIASINAIIGAGAAGALAFTATSGPGLSLMQEGIGYAAMTEIPCVIVDVQRGGPSTGLPTKASQADVMQSRWGSHGDRPAVSISPSTIEEAFYFTAKAFEISQRLRIPVIVLADEIIAHMREVVELPEEVEIWKRQKPQVPPGEYLHYNDSNNFNAPYAAIGEGFKIHHTGLTHRPDGFPTSNLDVIRWKMHRLRDKIEKNRDYLEMVQIYGDTSAPNVIVSFGASARAAMGLVEEKDDAFVVKLDIIWPLPENKLRDLLKDKKKIVVAEMNMGQITGEIRRILLRDDVKGVFRYDGELISIEDIEEVLYNE